MLSACFSRAIAVKGSESMDGGGTVVANGRASDAEQDDEKDQNVTGFLVLLKRKSTVQSVISISNQHAYSSVDVTAQTGTKRH